MSLEPAESWSHLVVRIDLLVAVLEIFSEAASLTESISTEPRDGWSRFALYFTVHARILSYELKQNLQVGRILSSAELIDGIVNLLADFVGIDDLPCRLWSPFAKLEILSQLWKTEEDMRERQRSNRSCINFGDEEKQKHLLSSIQMYSNQFVALNTNISDFTQQFQPITPALTAVESLNFQAGDAVSLLHEAFCRRLSCGCSDVHGIWARIALSTYQGSLLESLPLEYDIILGLVSSKDEWKEALVRIKNYGSPYTTRFTPSFPPSPPNRDGQLLRQPIEQLCKPIRSSLSNPYARLSLELEDERLFKLKSDTNSHFKPDDLCQPTTLTQVIQRRAHAIGEKAKRILAVILSYSVFHLHGGPWLATSWHKNDIVFLSSGSKTSLRPFLCRKLAAESCGGRITSFDVNGSEFDPDDFPLHPYPELVSLGILLIEVYFTCTIEDLAKQHEVDLIEDVNARFCAVLEIFKTLSSNMSDRYRAAVDACLDPNIEVGIDNQEKRSREQSVRALVYQKIVRPLKDELETGFGSSFPIGAIDAVAMDIDIGQPNSRKRKQHFEEPALEPRTPLSQLSVPAGSRGIPEAEELHLGTTTLTQSAFSAHDMAQINPFHYTTDVYQLRTEKAFQVAVICALQAEADAVHAVMDSFWDGDSVDISKAAGDDNTYTYGTIGRHNIVLAYMTGIGNISASSVATNLRNSFPNISLALIVGVCGGVPSPASSEEIHLGDLIISTSVMKYDFGRGYDNGFVPKDTSENQPGRPSRRIRNSLAKWKTRHYRQKIQQDMAATIEQVQEQFSEMCHPGYETDQLYDSTYVHRHHRPHADCSPGCCDSDAGNTCGTAIGASCAKLDCDPARVVRRSRRKSQPVVHFGTIGSSDTVMKSGIHRDQLANKYGLVGFEMEGAGVWDQFPCVVVKGVCDYADSHKNKDWQSYASAVAAAGMKALLNVWEVPLKG